MLALARHHHRLIVLTSSAVAGIAFLGFVGASDGNAPAAPQPLPVAALLSPSGKIIDRLPGGAPPPPNLAERFARADWTGAGTPDLPAVLVSASAAEVVVAEVAVDGAVAAATDAPTPVPLVRRSARAAVRPHKAPAAIVPAVVAALPPPRPTSLRVVPDVVEVASTGEKRVSIAGRMVAFVGSLASFARLL